MSLARRFALPLAQRALASAARFSAGRSFASVASALNDMVAAHPTVQALSIEEQNIKWTFTQLKTHSEAALGGMRELGLVKGDVIVQILVPGSEKTVLEIAAACGGMTVANLPASSSAQAIRDAVSKLNAAALYVSLDAQEGMLDTLKSAFPELTMEAQYGGPIFEGELLRFNDFPSLKYICHPAFADVPGTLRLRDILSYQSRVCQTGQFDSDCDKFPAGITVDGQKVMHKDVVGKISKAGISANGLLG